MGFERVWSLLVPARCPVCDTAGPAPCPTCWARLSPAPPGAPPPGVDRCRSLLRYDDAGRELLARLKYRNSRGALGWLAAGMAELVADAPEGFDAVTWAPTTPARRRQRGFDQAELLAKVTARRLGVPARRLLVRAAGPPQTGRSGADRRSGPRFASHGHPPARVVLVDDVLTTGATVAQAAAALRSAGVTSVIVVTGGRTPLKVHPEPVDP